MNPRIQGKQARIAGLNQSDCPYPVCSDSWHQWLDGWATVNENPALYGVRFDLPADRLADRAKASRVDLTKNDLSP